MKLTLNWLPLLTFQQYFFPVKKENNIVRIPENVNCG